MADEPESTEDRRGCPPGKGTVAPEHGGRIGNPAFHPTEEQREQVKLYCKVLSQEMTAQMIGISVDTLQRHFAEELREGKLMAVAKVGGLLLAKALEGDLGAMIFYLKTQGKWSTRLEVQPTMPDATSDEGGDMMADLIGMLTDLARAKRASGAAGGDAAPVEE